jgi:hypothetical protein
MAHLAFPIPNPFPLSQKTPHLRAQWPIWLARLASTVFIGEKTTLLKPKQQEKYNDLAAQFDEPLYYLLVQWIDPITTLFECS